MTIEPVRKQVLLKATQEKAFRVFTEQVDTWWPRAHHIGKSPLKQAVLESGEGGRWYTQHEDGSETNTGRVLVCEPPSRLVLSWQITSQWQFDPDFLTEVEVTFTPQGQGETLVKIEHRNLERYGDATAAFRESINSEGGWSAIMSAFAKAAESDQK